MIALRPYQKEAQRKVRKALANNQRPIINIATGGGKTLTAMSLIKDDFLKPNGRSIIWVAHTEELLEQAEKCALRDLKIPPEKIFWWRAGKKIDLNDVPNGSLILTMILSTKTMKWPPKKKKPLLLVDETHRDAAKSYRALEKNTDPVYKIGLTATPWRMDKKSLDYDCIAFKISLLELAALGYAAAPKYIRINTHMSFKINKNKNDFTGAALKTLSAASRCKLVVNTYVKNINRFGQTVIFAPSVKAAENIKKGLTKQGILAEIISSNTDKADRARIQEEFKSKKIHVLVNMNILTEGIDIPNINTIMLARPTLSKSLYCQMIGRGARVLPDKKQFLIVDFIDNISYYPLIAESWSIELLGTKGSKAYYEAKEQKDVEDILKKKVGKVNKAMLNKVGSVAQALDLIGVIEVTMMSKSISTSKKVISSIPLFIQDLPYLLTASHMVRTSYKMNVKSALDFIKSSFSRGGINSSLTEEEWSSIMWALYYFVSKRWRGSSLSKYKIEPIEVKYFVPVDKPKPNIALFDMTEPLTPGRAKEVFEKLAKSNNLIRAHVGLVDISHNVLFLVANTRQLGHPTINLIKSFIKSSLEKHFSGQYFFRIEDRKWWTTKDKTKIKYNYSSSKQALVIERI